MSSALYDLLYKTVLIADRRRFYMNLGEMIKEYRANTKCSMGDFAKKSGLSKAYISILERNLNPVNGKPAIPSLKTIKTVASAMGREFDEVFEKLDQTQKVSLGMDADSVDAYFRRLEADGRKREQTWVENTPQGLIIAPEPIDGHYDLSYRSSHEKEELRNIIASILHELDRYEDRGHIGAAKVLMHAAKIIWTRNDEGISRIDEYVSMIGSNENYAEYDLPAYLLPGFSFDHEGFSEEDADAAFRDWIEHQPEDVRKKVLHPQKEEK